MNTCAKCLCIHIYLIIKLIHIKTEAQLTMYVITNCECINTNNFIVNHVFQYVQQKHSINLIYRFNISVDARYADNNLHIDYLWTNRLA